MKDDLTSAFVTLNALIVRLSEGRFVIPDFQREFEWKPADIRELMRSVFLNYYIGNLLLWKGSPENFNALSCENIYGFNNKNVEQEHIVLDGQQRLTALYYAFFAPDVPPSRKHTKHAIYFVRVDKFMNEEYDDAFEYDWRTRRFEEILKDREKQFKEHVFPFSMIGKNRRELSTWLREYERYWEQQVENDATSQTTRLHADNAKKFYEHVNEIILAYKVSYIELEQKIEIDKVCDIFTKINNQGVQLNVFDLINALLKPKNVHLKDMWRKAAPRLEFVNADKMNVYILQVISILKQNYCSSKYLYFLIPGKTRQIRDSDGTQRGEVLVPQNKDFEKLWNQAVSTIEHSIKILRHPQEFGVTSSKYLPYHSILPVFSALQAHVKEECSPEIKIHAGHKVERWYWASVFMNRYSSSTEATSARDFRDVKKWIADDTYKPPFIEEFRNQFRGIELGKESKSGTSIYNGIFNLLVRKGARDWFTGKILQPEDIDDHHIIPNSWGKDNLEGDTINVILNRTPLTTNTNRKVVGKKLPNEYLPGLIERNGREKILDILETHFISPNALEILLLNPFTPDDFEKFIEERQKTIQDAIEKLVTGERKG